MRTSRTFSSLLILLAALFLVTQVGLAADPGQAYSPDNAASDQKAGSVLFFNIYTSDATSPTTQNTKFSITNTSPSEAVAVHLFFVDGVSCSPADFIVCLTPSQTISYDTADLDPNTEGYIVAVAVDGNGLPKKHNYLIGQEFVKFASGHQAGLGAIAVASNWVQQLDETAVMADLLFDRDMYEQLPAVLAIDNIPSRVSNNDTMVIINRPSGDLALGANSIGSIFGLLYNDTENAYSFNLSSSRCQYRFSFNNTTPRTAPRFTTVVPDGRTGWVKFYSVSGAPLIGAMINYNSSSGGVPTAYTGGHNLHQLRLTNATLRIPIYPASCFDR